jgi:hypothetical protein
MTARFLPGSIDLSAPPPNWAEVNGIEYCLGCRRELAGDARAETLSDDDSLADRIRAHAEGRIEFELDRDPDRCDTRVARACKVSVQLVRQVRDRIGVYPTRPV